MSDHRKTCGSGGTGTYCYDCSYADGYARGVADTEARLAGEGTKTLESGYNAGVEETKARLQPEIDEWKARYSQWEPKDQIITDQAFELARLKSRYAALVEAARLKRNAIIYDNPGFEGNWIAVPRQDFDALRAALRALDEPKEKPAPPNERGKA